jgi:predicted TIM-barrel fold metal-dependent hydrolase
MEKIRIFDSHTHMPSIRWKNNKDFFKSVTAAIDYLKSTGVSKAIFNMWQGVLSETADDLEEGNKEALEIAAQSNGVLYPGVSMNPDFPEESLKWLVRFHELGFRWAGELLTYKTGSFKSKCKYNDPPFVKFIEKCAQLNFIVQLHVEPEIIDLARMFPKLTIICSHITNDDFLSQLVRLDNTYIDISGMEGGLHIGRLEKAIEIFGTKRLLFGSDFTGYDPLAFIARVKKTVPDTKKQNDIFCNNLMCLMTSVGVTI